MLPAVRVKSLQSCPTLCSPVDCSPPDSSVRGLLQARTLEWVAMPFSRASSPPRDRTHVYALAVVFFTTELPGKPHTVDEHSLKQLSGHSKGT